MATKSNVASTLLLVWTGLYVPNCDAPQSSPSLSILSSSSVDIYYASLTVRKWQYCINQSRVIFSKNRKLEKHSIEVEPTTLLFICSFQYKSPLQLNVSLHRLVTCMLYPDHKVVGKNRLRIFGLNYSLAAGSQCFGCQSN